MVECILGIIHSEEQWARPRGCDIVHAGMLYQYLCGYLERKFGVILDAAGRPASTTQTAPSASPASIPSQRPSSRGTAATHAQRRVISNGSTGTAIYAERHPGWIFRTRASAKRYCWPIASGRSIDWNACYDSGAKNRANAPSTSAEWCTISIPYYGSLSST